MDLQLPAERGSAGGLPLCVKWLPNFRRRPRSKFEAFLHYLYIKFRVWRMESSCASTSLNPKCTMRFRRSSSISRSSRINFS
jgi:hypothetical protein